MPKTKKHITRDELARMVARGFDNTATKDDVRRLEKRTATVEESMATKSDLLESEERLLTAIRGIEVRKDDFESLQQDVKELASRVEQLEKRVGAR